MKRSNTSKKLQNKYRIDSDRLLGYTISIRYWWLPVAWFPLYGGNSCNSVEMCYHVINCHKTKRNPGAFYA